MAPSCWSFIYSSSGLSIPILAALCFSSNCHATSNSTKKFLPGLTERKFAYPATMQFTIELTNLTKFIFGRNSSAEGKLDWKKMKSEGRTGKVLEEEDGLRLLFPNKGNRNQTQEAKSSRISALIAMAREYSSQPMQKFTEQMSHPVSTSIPKSTIVATYQPTSTSIVGVKTTTRSNLPSTTKDQKQSKTTKMMIIVKSNVPSSTSIPLPFRLHFLLTRRIQTLMATKKKVFPSQSFTSNSSHLHPPFPSASTLKPTTSSKRTISIRPIMPAQPGKGQFMHDTDQRIPLHPPPLPLVFPNGVKAPGLSPKAPGSLPDAAVLKPMPTSMSSGPKRECCGRREVDGETRGKANHEDVETRNGIGIIQQWPFPPAANLPNGVQRSRPMQMQMFVPKRPSGRCCPPAGSPSKCCRPKCFDCPIVVPIATITDQPPKVTAYFIPGGHSPIFSPLPIHPEEQKHLSPTTPGLIVFPVPPPI